MENRRDGANVTDRQAGLEAGKKALTSDQRNAFLAALLGWSMDSFDYFLVVFVLADIAKDKSFGATATQLAFITTATLVMRPVGALLFGLWVVWFGWWFLLFADVLLY